MLLTWIIVFIVGVAIGSFLNVVIHRAPRMLLEDLIDYSLLKPASHCVSCKRPLRWYHNIPLFSFILLKGRCAFCSEAISWRYPSIELISGLVGLILLQHFGLTPLFFAAAMCSAFLLCLMMIDWQHQLLPDNLTLSLMWLGLLVNSQHLFVAPEEAIIGAASGYMILWVVAMLYQKITQREGMGYGDFKLLAALGAWLGWQSLPMIVLIASILGSLVGVAAMMFKKYSAKTPIAFGPYLVIAGWWMLIFFPIH